MSNDIAILQLCRHRLFDQNESAPRLRNNDRTLSLESDLPATDFVWSTFLWPSATGPRGVPVNPSSPAALHRVATLGLVVVGTRADEACPGPCPLVILVSSHRQP